MVACGSSAWVNWIGAIRSGGVLGGYFCQRTPAIVTLVEFGGMCIEFKKSPTEISSGGDSWKSAVRGPFFPLDEFVNRCLIRNDNTVF